MKGLTQWLIVAAAVLGVASLCWAGTRRERKPPGVVKALDLAVRELRRSDKRFVPEENRITIERWDGEWMIFVERVGTGFIPLGSESWVHVRDNGTVEYLPGL